MVAFHVNDMTCGHCASAISRAVAGIDKNARLDVRIQQKLVRIDSTAPAGELAAAIQDAGYTPVELGDQPQQPVAPRASGGCGCGCGPKAAAVDARQQAPVARGSCCS